MVFQNHMLTREKWKKKTARCFKLKWLKYNRTCAKHVGIFVQNMKNNRVTPWMLLVLISISKPRYFDQ